MENKFISFPHCIQCGEMDYKQKEDGIYECSYCSCKIKLSSSYDESELNQATSDREIRRFDDAYERYENILKRDQDNELAAFGAILSYYGIIYEKDEGKYIPTCHRTLEQSIYDFKYYSLLSKEHKKACAELEGLRIEVLEEMNSINEDYDVFICYKASEIDSNNATQEAKLARDMYEYLTYNLNLKVFYSEKSLAGHSGNYEPRIYSALKKAKLMLVLASSKEHVEAPWVENEWKRFYAFKKEENDKQLICACPKTLVDMLPQVLKMSQTLDYEALDFKEHLTSLVREIFGKVSIQVVEKKKIEKIALKPNEPGEEQLMNVANGYLQDKRFDRAIKYAEDALAQNDTNREAYLCFFLASNKINKLEDLWQLNSVVELFTLDKIYALSDDKERERIENLLEKRVLYKIVDTPFVEYYLSYRQTDIMKDMLTLSIKKGAYNTSILLAKVLIGYNVNDYSAHFALFLAQKEANNYLSLIKYVDNILDNENYDSAFRGYLATYPEKKDNIFINLEKELQVLKTEDYKRIYNDESFIIDVYSVDFSSLKVLSKLEALKMEEDLQIQEKQREEQKEQKRTKRINNRDKRIKKAKKYSNVILEHVFDWVLGILFAIAMLAHIVVIWIPPINYYVSIITSSIANLSFVGLMVYAIKRRDLTKNVIFAKYNCLGYTITFIVSYTIFIFLTYMAGILLNNIVLWSLVPVIFIIPPFIVLSAKSVSKSSCLSLLIMLLFSLTLVSSFMAVRHLFYFEGDALYLIEVVNLIPCIIIPWLLFLMIYLKTHEKDSAMVFPLIISSFRLLFFFADLVVCIETNTFKYLWYAVVFGPIGSIVSMGFIIEIGFEWDFFG